jgi:ketosteroid isomerase-like protein
MTATTATVSAPRAVATAAALYDAFGRGDVPAILARLAPDVAWDAFPDSFAARAGVAHLRPGHGREHAAGFFETIGAWTARAFEVQAIVGDERTAVARIAAEFELPGGGAFRDEELHLWRIDSDGRVTEFRHYVDTAKHIAAAQGQDTRR